MAESGRFVGQKVPIMSIENGGKWKSPSNVAGQLYPPSSVFLASTRYPLTRLPTRRPRTYPYMRPP